MKSKKDILLVEDNEEVISVLKENLAKEDEFTLYIAKNLRDARYYIENTSIDLVSLDIMLPDGNGLDFCKEIKQNSEYSNIKVIVLSQRTDLCVRLKSFDLDADDYLGKPFFPQEFTARIKRLLLKTDSRGVIRSNKYKSIKLLTLSNEVEINSQRIKLTRNESLFIEYLLKSQNISNARQILHFISNRRDKCLKSQSLNVLILRLRAKLYKFTGMKVIKTRYGLGYYIGL